MQVDVADGTRTIKFRRDGMQVLWCQTWQVMPGLLCASAGTAAQMSADSAARSISSPAARCAAASRVPGLMPARGSGAPLGRFGSSLKIARF